QVLTNLSRILAAELLCAAQAIELRAPLEPAPATRAALEVIRARVPFTQRDRFLAPDLEAMQDLVESGEAVKAAGKTTREGRAAGRKS
ncbi:MAG: histidine ammonia-lyase, partial [Rubrobacteraceae bacterium]|nr:histidine ammonia-lyase [Rubrobacteraceae bacterium]